MSPASAMELAMLLLRLRRPLTLTTLFRREVDGDGVRVIRTPRWGK